MMVLTPFRKVVKFASSSKGAKITLLAWLAVAVLLSAIAPSANDYSVSSKEGSVKEDTPAQVASELLKERFPQKDGLIGLLVFHRESGITDEDHEKITELSKWLSSDEVPKHVTSALPFHEFPAALQEQMFSKDKQSLLINFAVEESIDSGLVHDTLEEIRAKVDKLDIGHLEFEITGPAGISADTITIFRNADFILMIGTVILIFVLLIIIYRSPLLAVIPLAVAAIVYAVVNRILGIAGKNDWFVVDGAAVSIMLVLLFAVLTDYSLFIFSRYREELKKDSSKYSAMRDAMYHVSEPIVFSGGTVLLAVLTLFTATFKPYNHFAPVFSVAIIVILIAGLTLIPSFFALMGRKAFWPFIPKSDDRWKTEKKGFWYKVSKLVIYRPALLASVLLGVLLVGAINIPAINYSFNLLKSFPEDMSSRKGFELLENHYPTGQLAPVTVILEADQAINVDEDFLNNVKKLEKELKKSSEIESVQSGITDDMLQKVTKLPHDFIDEKQEVIKLQIVLKDNPYEVKALDTVQALRNQGKSMLENSGFSTSNYELHFAGQTAEQVDVRNMNHRDIIVLFSLVTLFITIMLGFQTRSVAMAFLMMTTIVLSYVATLGFSWLIFKYMLGLESISYRLPVYTFVFMVALGIDYNIMLVSRIREEAKKHPWREAVGRGVILTGGVISSAGMILAATFAVLMTQPLQELFLFGLTMAIGIMMDTFLIRGMLLPSLFILIKKKNKHVEQNQRTV